MRFDSETSRRLSACLNPNFFAYGKAWWYRCPESAPQHDCRFAKTCGYARSRVLQAKHSPPTGVMKPGNCLRIGGICPADQSTRFDGRWKESPRVPPHYAAPANFPARSSVGGLAQPRQQNCQSSCHTGRRKSGGSLRRFSASPPFSRATAACAGQSR